MPWSAAATSTPQRLFVTGGSGGGVLTAWIVGHTDRFRAAVVVKPVINWTSFVLTGDMTNYFYRYWFGEFPWDDMQAYWKRSPLAYVGNVHTPTMLMTGEVGLPHAVERGGTILPGAEAAQGRHRPGARSERLARHFRAAQPADRQGGLRARVVQVARREIAVAVTPIWPVDGLRRLAEEDLSSPLRSWWRWRRSLHRARRRALVAGRCLMASNQRFRCGKSSRFWPCASCGTIQG